MFCLPRRLNLTQTQSSAGSPLLVLVGTFSLLVSVSSLHAQDSDAGVRFFENKIRPVLAEHCYECHSEEAGEQQGGLLLDRQAGWTEGGSTGKAVVPGDPESSLLLTAIRYDDDAMQMPPEGKLDEETIELFRRWIANGAPGPATDLGNTSFSRLGDQDYLFDQAADHWAFQPIADVAVPVGEAVNASTNDGEARRFSDHPIDRFVRRAQEEAGLAPSPPADPAVLVRRLTYDLTGLPPTYQQVQQFKQEARRDLEFATENRIERLMASPAFGEHLGRLWLDVVRYADTDNNYRPDTRTPHYFPFAFSYRDYVVDAFNHDKPYDQFLKEQLAADLMGFEADEPETAALGFYATGPFATRAQAESLDDWIDVTTRGLMGMTVACARCHDHKFEPVPTADYYSLRGIFAAVNRVNPLNEQQQPKLSTYTPTQAEIADYEKKRAAIDKKIREAEGKKAKNNNRSVTQRIRETELAELMLFHPGAPARAMRVVERKQPPRSFVFIRGDAASRGEPVDRQFLKVLDPEQPDYPEQSSGRLQLARDIASADNPLTARVFVNRVWGYLMGSHLVATPSDFGLQGSPPSHPELLDWLARDFIDHNWSTKHLVRRIVTSQTYRQSSQSREAAAAIDPENRLLWRANRKHLSIEAIRDSMLAAAGELEQQLGGHPEKLWGENATRRRTLYGFINRFNHDPTLRAFDFPAPIQTQPPRGESIVAFQALFTMNSPFVIHCARSVASTQQFQSLATPGDKVRHLFQTILGRDPASSEVEQTLRLVRFQQTRNDREESPRGKGSSERVVSPWPLVAQALMMSNEFQYID